MTVKVTYEYRIAESDESNTCGIVLNYTST